MMFFCVAFQKTFTMMGPPRSSNGTPKHLNGGNSNFGLYYMAALDIFHALKAPEFAGYSVRLSFFEIYSGKLLDLLNERTLVKCLEDHKGNVCFPGLTQHPVSNADALMRRMEEGAVLRSTGTTSRNADSSRSHAVLQLHLYRTSNAAEKDEYSRLTLIDLAGSERGADTSTASRATRLEGAEINTSLLALKEVIRALATGDTWTHVPFRGSKLTQVLKQSFVGQNCRSVMIACVSPNMANCEPTLNTLRYADRVKERHPETGALVVPKVTTPVRSSVRSASAAIGGGVEVTQNLSSDVLLDELLSSPNAGAGEELIPPQDESTLEELLATHKDATEVMFDMIQEEMVLVNTTSAAAKNMDSYITNCFRLQEEQLAMITLLREQLRLYRRRRVQGALEPVFHVKNDDDSFEDLRD
jgi:kinesin family member 2/24